MDQGSGDAGELKMGGCLFTGASEKSDPENKKQNKSSNAANGARTVVSEAWFSHLKTDIFIRLKF